MADKGKNKALLESIVAKFPALPVAWKDLSVLIEDDDLRLQAVNHGLDHDPDGETKGILLINKAMTLHRLGDRDGAVEILGELALDPQSTLCSEALAKATLANLLQ